jgi:glycosyltransferase involved in cell wall biosynthesis
MRAFSHLVHEFPDTTLVLAGPGDPHYVSTLHALTQELGIGERVIFTGLLEGRMVREAYADADLFVLPSLQENFGLAVAEAMAAGCPVVVTPEVALAHQIEGSSAGLVVKGEVDDISRAMRLLLGDETRRRTMGANGRRLVLDRFTWDRVSVQVLGVYQDIVKGTRASAAWR